MALCVQPRSHPCANGASCARPQFAQPVSNGHGLVAVHGPRLGTPELDYLDMVENYIQRLLKVRECKTSHYAFHSNGNKVTRIV